MWEGRRGARPWRRWRDTGVALRGPAVRRRGARVRATRGRACGHEAPECRSFGPEAARRPAKWPCASVAATPGTTGLFRLDQLVATLARRGSG
jgi:cardiolipin synthase